MSNARQLLVVGPAWVGDMVMAQALFKQLKTIDAAGEIDVLAPRWSLPLLSRMPEIRRGIGLDIPHGRLGLSERRKVARELERVGYAQAIVLPRSLKAALIPYLARIPRRTGFRGECRYGLINDMRPFDAESLDQTVKRFLALGLDSPSAELPRIVPPKLRTDQVNLRSLCERFGLDTASPVAAVMPGAEYGPAKRWPLEKYAALTSQLTEAGASVWVLGSLKEKQLGRELQDLAADPRVHNLCGETELVDAVDLLSVAVIAVTNDSGLMHVAAAVGTRVIAIYGSSTPDFTPPLTEARIVFYRDLDCSPCFERTCPLGHLACLRTIEADDVAQTCLPFLERSSSARAAHDTAND